MRWLLPIPIGGALLGLLGCARPSFEPADRDAIRAVMTAQQQAWNAGDIEGFMRGYHPREDIVFTSGAQVRRGFDATLAAYTRRYVDGSKMGHLEFSDLEISELGATAAVVLGRWQLTETPEAGGGVFSLVFREEDGRWGIVHDHSSADPEPEGE